MAPQRKRPASVAAVCGKKKRIIGNYCAVPGCSNYAGKTRGLDVSYFKFPSQPSLHELWVRSIRRGGRWNSEKSHVCSAHFKDSDFERDFKAELLGSKKRKILKTGVVPTQNLPPSLEEEDSQSGYSFPNEDRRSFVTSLPNDQIIEFEFGSSDESVDASTTYGVSSNQQSDGEGEIDHPDDKEEAEVEDDGVKGLETARSHLQDFKTNKSPIVDNHGAENETKETIITFEGCEQSQLLKTEINKLRMELKAKEDSMFILEQSSAFKAKQQTRIIAELIAENNSLKAELKEKNEKLSTLEEALGTDTKLRSIFSPDELIRFLKLAKKCAET